MTKRVSVIILAVMLSIGVNGCGRTDKPADLKVKIGEHDIKCIILKNTEADSANDKKNTFKFAFEQNTSEDIKYIKIGERVILDFGSSPPDKLTIRDGLLKSDGERLYSDREIVEVPSVRENNKYNFLVTKHMAARLSSASMENRTVFRGYRITAYHGEDKHEYAFVIKTDAY